MNIGFKRMMKLIELATKERNKRTNQNSSFDVIAAMEFGFAWSGKDFIFQIEADNEWSGKPNEEAFVEFSPRPSLTVRESVYIAAEKGDRLSRFTIAHEIAHALLHRNLAGRRLARAAHQKYEKRTNSKQENEANIFAGALLIHFPSIKKSTTAWELQLVYNVSSDVARKAIEQAAFIRYKTEIIV